MLDSKQREKIHIAAVISCNFTNHMLTISEKLMKDNDLDFDLLKPLIKETVNKALVNSPKKVQTGPAYKKGFKNTRKTYQLIKL